MITRIDFGHKSTAASRTSRARSGGLNPLHRGVLSPPLLRDQGPLPALVSIPFIAGTQAAAGPIRLGGRQEAASVGRACRRPGGGAARDARQPRSPHRPGPMVAPGHEHGRSHGRARLAQRRARRRARCLGDPVVGDDIAGRAKPTATTRAVSVVPGSMRWAAGTPRSQNGCVPCEP